MALPPVYDATDFQQAMLRLLPRGRVWRRDPGSMLSALLLALAPTYVRSMASAAQVLIDASPATTQNLLAEWEASLGLPDACTAANPSVEQRQAAVRAKWGARGSLTIGYFVALAANLGFAITITEFTPFAVDQPCDAVALRTGVVVRVAGQCAGGRNVLVLGRTSRAWTIRWRFMTPANWCAASGPMLRPRPSCFSLSPDQDIACNELPIRRRSPRCRRPRR